MNPEQRAAQDAGSTVEIDIDDRADVERWAQALGSTDSAVLAAVKVVGRRIDRIKDYLGAGGMAGHQQDG